MRLGEYRRALQTALRQNSSAFGFSVVVTTSFAMLSQLVGTPKAAEGLLFALGAVISFTALDVLATEGFRRRLATDPPEVITHASSLSFLSVGLGITVAIGIAELIDSLVAWPLAGFAASATYILLVGAELDVAQRRSDARSERDDRERSGGEA